MKPILHTAAAAVAMIMALGIMTSGCGGGISVESPASGATDTTASSPPATQPTTPPAPSSEQPAPPVSGANIATLQWEAPLSPIDGSPVAGIAGYRVYYGPASGTYTNSLDAGSVLTYSLSGLAPGTYFFTVTAYDSSSMESAYSNEVSKTI